MPGPAKPFWSYLSKRSGTEILRTEGRACEKQLPIDANDNLHLSPTHLQRRVVLSLFGRLDYPNLPIPRAA